MISPEMAVDIVTPYPLTIQNLEKKAALLEEDLRRITSDRSFWQERFQERENQVNELEEYVNRCAVYMDDETSQRLVEIFGLKSTKEYDVEVTVTFNGTVTVPLNYNMDELEDALEVRIDTSYLAQDITADFMDDGYHINWSEA